MNKISSDRIVYRGISKPAGTKVEKIRPPTTRNPIFVGSTPEVALSYIDAANGSVYVMLLKESPKKLALDLNLPNDCKKIGKKLPKTAKALEYHLQNGGDNSLFSLMSLTAVPFLRFIAQNNDFPNFNENDYTDEKEMELIKDMLLEMDVLKISNGKPEITDKELENLVNKSDEDLDHVNKEQHMAGRILKEFVNKAAKDLGYLMVGDYDTSLEDAGIEYAIFDKSVFEGGVPISVSSNDIGKAKRAILKGIEFSPTKIPNNIDELVEKTLKRNKKGIITDTTIKPLYKSHIKNLVIPDNIKYLDSFSFASCPNIEFVTIPRSVRYISVYSFRDSSKLKNIVFEKGFGKGLTSDTFVDKRYDGKLEYYKDESTQFSEAAFRGISPNAIITIHSGTDPQLFKHMDFPKTAKFRIID